MKVGLFIPCYVDHLYPDVAKATLAVLDRYDIDVAFPLEQTCCGQPMANTGCTDDARPVAERFVSIFKPFDAIVCPSGSCTSMVRNHYKDILPPDDDVTEVSKRTYELCEFLVDVLKVDSVQARFPHKVGLHQSCHGLRELRLGNSSERNDAPFSKVRTLLETVEGIELVDLARKDECCGFGGTFAISEDGLSQRMGCDRLDDHQQAGADFITGVDMSCLMHLQGLSEREKRAVKFKHVAEILASV